MKFVGYGKVGLPGIKFSLNRFHALTRGFGDTDSAGRTVLVPRAAHTLPVGADKTCKTKTWLKSKGFVIQQSPHWFMIIRFLNRYMGAYLGKGPYWQLITLCWLYFGVMFQI